MKKDAMELLPQNVWDLIGQLLNQQDRSSARAASRFFFKRFTLKWDQHFFNNKKIRFIAGGYSHSLALTDMREVFGCGWNANSQLGLGHNRAQNTWVKLNVNPYFAKAQRFFTTIPNIDELQTQRYLAFIPATLKILLQSCDRLLRKLYKVKNKIKQEHLFSLFKLSTLEQFTESLPEPWNQEFEHLTLEGYMDFYHRLREHFRLEPIEESHASKKCSMM